MHPLRRRSVLPAALTALAVATAGPTGAASASGGGRVGPVHAGGSGQGGVTAAGPGARADRSARLAPGSGRLASRGLVADLAPGTPAPPAVSASSYVLADLDTGDVLAAKDPHGRYAPASTLKILTALTLLPALDQNRWVPASYADAAVGGTRVGIVPGAQYSVRNLFQALMMVSGNDAALTLADAHGGPGRTVADMNALAKRLGATDTVAVNPHGLDAPGQVTSAYDLALLGRDGMRDPAFATLVGTRRALFGARGASRFEIYTHNRLVINYPGAIGVKNGYTSRARASFVGAAQRGGHRMLVSLVHADPRVWHEAAALLDWGFAHRGGARASGALQDPSAPSGTGGAGGGGASTPLAHRLPASPGAPATRQGRPYALLAGCVAVLLLASAAWARGSRHHRRRRRVRRVRRVPRLP